MSEKKCVSSLLYVLLFSYWFSCLTIFGDVADGFSPTSYKSKVVQIIEDMNLTSNFFHCVMEMCESGISVFCIS